MSCLQSVLFLAVAAAAAAPPAKAARHGAAGGGFVYQRTPPDTAGFFRTSSSCISSRDIVILVAQKQRQSRRSVVISLLARCRWPANSRGACTCYPTSLVRFDGGHILCNSSLAWMNHPGRIWGWGGCPSSILRIDCHCGCI